MLQVIYPGQPPFAVYQVEDRYFVTEDTCTHGKASLADEGELEGYVVTCSWHDGRFDIRTGAVVAAPCTQPIKAFPVAVEDGAVWIEIDEERIR
jgi:nitrite reductase/ring-hydroxylating ferredoxin subunit